jgi:hypothetical protein
MSEPCPRCGYVEGKSVTPMSNHMNEYVDEKTGASFGILNSNADTLTIKGQALIKKDKFVKVPPVPKK